MQNTPNWSRLSGMGLLIGLACVTLACVRDTTPDGPVAPCQGPFAIESWWVEPDLYPEAFDTRDEYNQAVRTAREDLTRGQLHCWTGCPLLWDCLEAGLEEPYHIWGGLPADERKLVKKNDGILPSPASSTVERQDGSTRTKVTAMFREGASVSDIAVTIGRSEKTVWTHIRGALTAARHTREDTEPWESHPSTQPTSSTTAPEGETGEASPLGLARSQRSETQERMAS